MTVRLLGSVYHYRFMAGGKDYSGVCHGCATEKAAKEFEAKLRRESGKVRSHRSVAALVEEYKYELTGGNPIPSPMIFRGLFSPGSSSIPTPSGCRQIKATAA